MADHTYRSELTWSGSTRQGYRSYSRDHRVVAPPATSGIELSADPHFRGDPDRTNPEQLLVIAASSCQLLSFLALAARHHVDVTDYRDDAVGVMPSGSVPLRITRITLAPRIQVAAETDLALVERLVHEAHEQCYIANSLNGEVIISPTIAPA